MKKIEDFKVGDQAEFTHQITFEEIKKFAEITGDNNPLHVDKKFAEQTSFKGLVAHGMLSASLFSTMVGKHIPGDGALWIKQNFNFLLPVRPNDILKIKAEVRQISLTQKTMTIYISIDNQYGQKVLDGEGVVTLLHIESKVNVEKELNATRIKTVLVTGASRGIGAETVRLLASQKYRVILNYNSDKVSAEEIANELCSTGSEVITLKADVSDSSQVQTMINRSVQHFGYLTGLVNNASPKIIPVSFLDSNWESFQHQIDVQIKGAYNCIKAVLPQLISNKAGSIVTISSIAADAPPLFWTSYSSTKCYLSGFNRSLAAEFGSKNIRFNIVSPGTTDTMMISEISEKARLLIAMNTPLRKLANVRDIADSIEFLLSDKSKHITGENLRVCGGQVML